MSLEPLGESLPVAPSFACFVEAEDDGITPLRKVQTMDIHDSIETLRGFDYVVGSLGEDNFASTLKTAARVKDVIVKSKL